MARYEFYVSGYVKMEQEPCKKFHALTEAGIQKTEILRKALAEYLAKGWGEIIGEPEMLEAIILPPEEYKLLPEKVEA